MPRLTERIFSSYRLLAWADTLIHWLHLSRLPVAWRICDAYDLSLGTPDTPENFPRRHGV